MTDSKKPQVGDRVVVRAPGEWERRGVVVDTDYHPLGLDDAARVRLDDAPVPDVRWLGLRWVSLEADS